MLLLKPSINVDGQLWTFIYFLVIHCLQASNNVNNNKKDFTSYQTSYAFYIILENPKRLIIHNQQPHFMFPTDPTSHLYIWQIKITYICIQSKILLLFFLFAFCHSDLLVSFLLSIVSFSSLACLSKFELVNDSSVIYYDLSTQGELEVRLLHSYISSKWWWIWVCRVINALRRPHFLVNRK